MPEIIDFGSFQRARLSNRSVHSHSFFWETKDPKKLERFSKHKLSFLRMKAASNISTGRDDLYRLSVDKEPAVRAAALANPKIGLEAVWRAGARICRGEEDSWLVWVAAAGRKEIPEAALGTLFSKHNWNVMFQLAHAEHCPKDLLKKLADLPVEIVPVTALGTGGYDRWKEVREIAKDRL